MSERSNLSYTNKDFNSIYVELLEYAKKLSYKWDPTASDESDPGVVLLKLAAIIGDKDNYNIDKNVLELMPASVTQNAAARQIFDQCGYSMKYYRSAEGSINITIKQELGELEDGDRTTYVYKIPMFTMFTDADNTVVYTSTEEVQIPIKTETPILVIEGVATKYTINNDPLITLQNLDSENRIYFTETDIAENGIFITNVNSANAARTNYEQWKRVDNLQVQSKGSLCYKFGITLDSSICYLEFPDDVEALFGEGINITYIRTTGAQGNVSINTIREFYVDTKFIRTDTLGLDPVNVDATTENVVIRNTLPIFNGQDPESIDNAYKAYKRVRDTFDTLVSLKDYTDYMVTAEAASNGYVCDRTNDIQHTYKILKSDVDSTRPETVVDSSDMSAFDLCVYALQYRPVVSNLSTYKSTFMLTDGFDAQKVFEDDEVKSLQHNFKEFKENRILMLKNRYPVIANIVPKYTLSETEKNQLIYNIETALCAALNSKQLSFGSPIPVDLLQETIFNADSRIKTLIDFASPSYQTYAVFKQWNSNTQQYEFKELRIDNDSHDGGFVEIKLNKKKFNTIPIHPDNTDYKQLYYKTPTNTIAQVRSTDTFEDGVTYYTWDNTMSDLWHSFRTEIFAKNVLSGVTPLYVHEDSYTYSVVQTNTKEYEDISRITTNTDIKMIQNGSNSWEAAPLTENESILLTAPNFVEENNFSSYVKMIYSLNSEKDIPSGDRYELTGDEFIIFFWKASDSDTYYTYIKYDASDNSYAKFITPSGFDLPKQQVDISDDVLNHFRDDVVTGKGRTSSTITVGNTSDTETVYVTNMNSTAKAHVLSGTRRIRTENINQIHINNKDNGCSNIYWFLNSVNAAGKYQLFDDFDDTDNNDAFAYTLKSGEYFVYTNEEKTVLHILGEGTLIQRGGGWQTSDNALWSVDPVSYADLLTDGIDLLADKWVRIKKISRSSAPALGEESLDTSLGVWATEYQQILIGPNNILSLKGEGNTSITYTTTADNNFFVLSNKPTDLSGFSISYTDMQGNMNTIDNITSSNISWTATSLLNINVSNSVPQKLLSHQSFTFDQVDEDDHNVKITIKGNTEDDPLFVLSNRSVATVGGIDTPVSSDYLNTLNLLAYNIVTTDDYMIDDLSVTLSLPSGIQDGPLPTFKLIQGTYLLQVSSSKSINKLFIYDNNNNVTPLFEESSNPVKTLYKIAVSQDTDIELNLSYDSDVDFRLTISPLYKYNNTNLKVVSNDFESKLLEKLEYLDPEHEFVYSYMPANAIMNPLESTKFLNNRHFYNQYTICEWDAVAENNITVHDVVR